MSLHQQQQQQLPSGCATSLSTESFQRCSDRTNGAHRHEWVRQAHVRVCMQATCHDSESRSHSPNASDTIRIHSSQGCARDLCDNGCTDRHAASSRLAVITVPQAVNQHETDELTFDLQEERCHLVPARRLAKALCQSQRPPTAPNCSGSGPGAAQMMACQSGRSAAVQLKPLPPRLRMSNKVWMVKSCQVHCLCSLH
jgi:hypothetical protein